VSKVNNNSDLRYAFRTTLERVLRENPDEFAIVKLMPPVCEAVQKVVMVRKIGGAATLRCLQPSRTSADRSQIRTLAFMSTINFKGDCLAKVAPPVFNDCGPLATAFGLGCPQMSGRSSGGRARPSVYRPIDSTCTSNAAG
jgi:hypothetical protein